MEYMLNVIRGDQGAGEHARMVRVQADFKSDLIALARGELVGAWGPDAQPIPDDQILIRYFDLLRRHPAIRPRRLWIADDFQCPPANEAGWKLLQEKIANG
jgi:hypothetical protein